MIYNWLFKVKAIKLDCRGETIYSQNGDCNKEGFRIMSDLKGIVKKRNRVNIRINSLVVIYLVYSEISVSKVVI